MRTIIQTPTSNLQKSLDFYSKLDFDVVSDQSPTIVTDGKAFIEINPDRYARAGIKLYSRDWKDTIGKLKSQVSVIETDQGYLLSDTSGMRIYLIEWEDELALQLEKPSYSALGNYMGVGVETTDISRSKKVWSILGFERSDPNWPSYSNKDELTITFYEPNSCPHLFFNPSLTYFNGDKNPEVIEHIRQQNIPITEEITYFNPNDEVDNVIIRDPGGLGFFIFND